jgi:hypothetical protein
MLLENEASLRIYKRLLKEYGPGLVALYSPKKGEVVIPTRRVHPAPDVFTAVRNRVGGRFDQNTTWKSAVKAVLASGRAGF